MSFIDSFKLFNGKNWIHFYQIYPQYKT